MATRKTTKTRHKSPVETNPPGHQPMVLYTHQSGPAGFPVGSVQNGDLLTGASMVADTNALKDIVEDGWEDICQAQIDIVTGQREAKAEEVEKLRTTFNKTTANILFPTDFVADAQAAATAISKFGDDATVLTADGRKSLSKLTQGVNATQPLCGIALRLDEDGGGTVCYAAILQIKGSDRYGQSQNLNLHREGPVPANVTAAYKAWDAAKEELETLDRELVELAKTKQNAPKLGRRASSAASLKVMSQSPQGRQMLELIGKALAGAAQKKGLTVPTGEGGLLALVAAHPVTDSSPPRQ